MTHFHFQNFPLSIEFPQTFFRKKDLHFNLHHFSLGVFEIKMVQFGRRLMYNNDSSFSYSIIGHYIVATVSRLIGSERALFKCRYTAGNHRAFLSRKK